MSQSVENMLLSNLKCHPRNDEFFSNVEGEEFERLKQSIQELGILTPLRISADMTIISGHQRYRAAQELGLAKVPVVMDYDLEDEDEKLVQLIAANFGRMKNDPVKQGRWIAEYERLRGVRHGGSRQNNSVLITQDDIAAELGVDKTTLQNLKRLSTLLPEIQDIISDGRISATTGFKLVARLSEDEQHELLSLLPEAQRFTQSQVQEYVDQIRGLEAKNASLEAAKEAAVLDAQKWKEDAVEATKAVNESADPSRYMEMKNAKDAAEGKYRDEHEAFVQYRKDMAKQSIEWEKKLKEAEAKASRIPETVEVEVVKEVEVIPDDYEHLKEIEALYNQFHKYNNLDPSKVGFLGTPEEEQRNFEARYSDFLGGITSDLEGMVAEKDKLRKMPSDFQRFFSEQMSRIVEIVQEVLPELNITKEVA